MILSDAITAVSAQFDTQTSATSDTVIRSWIHRCLQDAVARAKWRKALRSLGPTVAGTSVYELPEDVVDVRSLRVASSKPWSRVSTEVLWEYTAGQLPQPWPGVFAPTFETVAEGGAVADGDAAQIALYPTPATSGQAIDALCAIMPPAIGSGTAAGTVLPVPEDLAGKLAVDGPIAMGYREALGRMDLAKEYEARFEAGIQELARRANSRVGHGPVRLIPGLRA